MICLEEYLFQLEIVVNYFNKSLEEFYPIKEDITFLAGELRGMYRMIPGLRGSAACFVEHPSNRINFEKLKAEVLNLCAH